MLRFQIYISVAFFFFCGLGAAMGQKAAYITVEGSSVAIDNLVMQDSIAGNRQLYSASFTINISDATEVQKVLNALQVNYFKTVPTNISIIHSRGAVNPALFDRLYRSANVLLMSLDKLEGGSRNVLKLAVKIRAGQLTETTGVTVKQPTLARAVQASNYLIEIPNLPTQRIATVSGLELKNNPIITLEISVADIAAWQQWLSSPGKKTNGAIFLMAPNMRDKIRVLHLVNAELVSITQNIVMNDDRIQRFTVLLKPAMLVLDEVK